MSPIRIQRKRTKGWKMPENTVYVGRPTKWGNPFRVQDFVSREACIVMFRRALLEQWGEYRLNDLYRELRGKNLACWCPLVDRDGNPVPCHADVLLEIANS